MKIGKKLLSIGSLALCALVTTTLALAGTDNTVVAPPSKLEVHKLTADFQQIGATSVIEIYAGESPLTSQKVTICNGDWMGTPRYFTSNWFTGQEYYATYQDPIETGCPVPVTYPFEVQSVKWHVFNRTGAVLNINIQPVIYTTDVISPACAKPGQVRCYGPMYNVNIPNGSVLITMPITCCVSGPYFAGVYAPDPIAIGMLEPVIDSAGFGGIFGASRTCGNYNNFGGVWQDFLGFGFPGNLRLWSEGAASDANSCDPCAKVIEPGVDLWTTPAGTSFDNHFTVSALPAGFFGPGSEPFGGSICLVGSPLTTNPAGALGSTDAAIRRLGSVPLLGVPDVGAVPIEIVALNLVSCNPITVTYGINPSQQWNIQVTLSSNMPQPQGQMMIRKTCCNGGMFDSQLPVLPKFIFTEVGNPSNVRVLDLGGLMPPIMFQSTGGFWSYDVPPPFDLVTCPGLVSCDNDLSPLTPDIKLPPSSKFTPGMRTLPCDPQAPNNPFCGGKALTLEQEQLAQHGVLPPQEVTPIEGACCLPDGSCIVTDPSCCQVQGGEYLGDFVPCPLDCTPETVTDSFCTNARIIVTLDPNDPICQFPVGPIDMIQDPGIKTKVLRTPGPPYIPGQIIETELIQMSLTGINPQTGHVNIRESPSRPSMGRTTVLGTDPFGNMTSGDSFFDVFFDITLPDIGRSFFNPNPTRMHGSLSALPPTIGTTFTRVPGPPELLLDAQGGFPVGFLCDALHYVVTCGCCVGIRGDANNDGGANPNVLDLTFLVDRIFRGGPPAVCPDEANVNGDGSVSPNVLDLTYLVDRIFRGGPPPGPCPII